MAFYDVSTSCKLRPRHLSGSWPRRFTEGQIFDLKEFNTPYVEQLRADWRVEEDEDENADKNENENEEEGEVGGEVVGDGRDQPEASGLEAQGTSNDEGDPEEDPEPMKDGSVARVFMRGRSYFEPTGMPEIYHQGTNVVEDFCGDITDPSLPIADTRSDPLAFLEDSSHDGTPPRSIGPMTSAQLYTELRQPRCPEVASGDSSQSSQDPQEIQPNAHKRRIYIHNITAHAAVVLMGTVSSYEAPAVQDLLSTHLMHEDSARVQIPSRGFQTFTFHLSIPFYTIEHDKILRDDRMCDGDFLRRIINIPELGNIRQAQTSFTLIGIDEKRWTAFDLTDSTRATASVQSYDSKLLPDRVLREDLVAGKKFVPDEAIADVRLYFLWEWEARVDKVLMEWVAIVAAVNQIVQRRSRDIKSMTGSEDSDEKIRRLKSTIDTTAVMVTELDRLKLSLFNIVASWQQFLNGDIQYFLDDGIQTTADSRRNDGLRALEYTYGRLGLKLAELEKLIETLAKNQPDRIMAATTNQRTLELAQNQEHAVNATRKLTSTSMCFLPVMLTFASFSMAPQALPFVPSGKAVLLALVIFAGVTLALINCLDSMGRKGQDLARRLLSARERLGDEEAG